MVSALEVGYRHLDTARSCANAREVGEGLRNSGVPCDAVLVTTKLLPGSARTEDVRACLEASLGDLGMVHVDLLLIHWPNLEVPMEETPAAMVALQGAGVHRRGRVPPLLRPLIVSL